MKKERGAQLLSLDSTESYFETTDFTTLISRPL
jgi:hypothetical protein